MPRSSAKSQANEGSVMHYGSVRMRVTGSGNLQLKLIGLDSVVSDVLVPIVMAAQPGQEPLRLANLTDQNAELEIKVTELDEKFTIHKIVVYSKPVATGYPIMS